MILMDFRIEHVDRPGVFTGAVLETPDGARWAVGDLTHRLASDGSEMFVYDVIGCNKHWTLDDAGKRHCVRFDHTASYFDDECSDWIIDTFDGGWEVTAKIIAS